MDIFNLWPLDMGGQATAEEAQRRRRSRLDEPAPVPAQLLAGAAHPFTHFNEPGGDPIQQGIELGLAGISPFRGPMTTMAPRMTAQEQLWQRAQQGDIQATGELTGEMFQRGIGMDELQGPPAPEPALQTSGPIHGGPGGAPRQDYNPYERLVQSDDYKPRGDYGMLEPKVGEIHGDMVWDGSKWERLGPSDEEMFRQLWRVQGQPNYGGFADPNKLTQQRPGGIFNPETRDFDLPPDRANLDYMPPDSNVPPRPPVDMWDLTGQTKKYDEAISNLTPEELKRLEDRLNATIPPDTISDLDPTFGGAFQEGISYDDWAEILSRMQATPPLPPKINPFRPGDFFWNGPEGYPDAY